MNKFILIIIVVLMVLPLAIPAQINFVTQSATRVGDNVTLKWKISTEKNVARFELEKFLKGEWTKFASVDGRGKNPPKEYIYFDGDTSTAEINYRIKLIDRDGSSTLSPEMTVAPKKPKTVEILGASPNPMAVSTSINYSLRSTETIRLFVVDFYGKEIKTLLDMEQAAGTYSIIFNSENLPSGIYFVWLSTNQQSTYYKIQITR